MLRLVLLCALLAGPARAAEGDFLGCQGDARRLHCSILLCDGDKTTPLDCAEVNLGGLGLGLPDAVAVAVNRTTGCTGTPDVTVRGLTDSLGAAHVYGTLTAAGTSLLTLAAPWHTHVDATLADTADCTDLEVVLEVDWKR